MSLRSSSIPSKPKVTVTLSFAGVKGYKALDILNNAPNLGVSKSSLVVDALLLYEKFQEEYGNESFDKIKKIIEEADD